MNLGPLVQKMQIIAVDGIDPIDCLIKLLLFQTLPLGSLTSARRSFRYVVPCYRKPHIRYELSNGLIRRQSKEFRREINHIALFLTAETDEILIDFHARCPVVMEGTAHLAVPADFVSVMLSHGTGADLLLDLGIDPQSITF